MDRHQTALLSIRRHPFLAAETSQAGAREGHIIASLIQYNPVGLNSIHKAKWLTLPGERNAVTLQEHRESSRAGGPTRNVVISERVICPSGFSRIPFESMLIIRDEHMTALKEHLLSSFVNRMEVHLKSAFPERPVTQDGPALRTLIHDGIATARRYGIVSDFDVQRYLEFMVAYGAEFHRAGWAARILNDKGLTASRRMDRLEDYAVFVLRS